VRALAMLVLYDRGTLSALRENVTLKEMVALKRRRERYPQKGCCPKSTIWVSGNVDFLVKTRFWAINLSNKTADTSVVLAA
jgi:hypothetical protein